jgi:hypothetical protein
VAFSCWLNPISPANLGQAPAEPCGTEYLIHLGTVIRSTDRRRRIEINFSIGELWQAHNGSTVLFRGALAEFGRPPRWNNQHAARKVPRLKYRKRNGLGDTLPSGLGSRVLRPKTWFISRGCFSRGSEDESAPWGGRLWVLSL